MNHGSLFSGIGGFDLAAKWMGWNNIFHCEINTFCQTILKHHFPQSLSYEDITKTDFSIFRGRIDILSGGFPCQPYSQAGKRKGKNDSRHLWPEMLRAIREIQPCYILGENVFGLVNWSKGLVFNEIKTDLENEGYKVLTVVLPACSVNAPHRRDRIWFIAYSDSFSNRRKSEQSSNSFEQRWSSETYKEIRNKGKQQSLCDNKIQRDAPDTSGTRSQSNDKPESRIDWQMGEKWETISNWSTWPSVSPICTGNDGISYRLDGITFSKWRNESIKAAGNAVVPQLVYKIFQTIETFDNVQNQKLQRTKS